MWVASVLAGKSKLPDSKGMLVGLEFETEVALSQQQGLNLQSFSLHKFNGVHLQKEYFQFIQRETHNAIKKKWSGRLRSFWKEEILKEQVHQHYNIPKDKRESP
jgi:hypothetical protein